jgi:hypothetical protein
MDTTYHQFRRINQFLLSNGKGLARLTYAGLNISTSFSKDGFSSLSDTPILQDTNASIADSILGGRFLRTDALNKMDGDIFGENSTGYSDFSIPWSITLGLTFSYTRSVINQIVRAFSLNTSFNFTIAESWKVSTAFQFDFISKQLITPQINLTKDMHCWDLTASWYPIGYNRGFYLRFGIKSSQLKDLKIEKRDSPIFR